MRKTIIRVPELLCEQWWNKWIYQPIIVWQKQTHTHIQHAKQKPHTQSNLKNMQKRKQKKTYINVFEL